MQIDSRPLPREQRVRHVGHVIRVRIADGVHAGDVRSKTLGAVGREPAAVQLDAHGLADVGPLGLGEAGEEGGALHGLALGEVDAEQVVLGRRGQAGVGCRVAAVAQPLDARDRAVVHRHVVNLQVPVPTGKAGVGGGARRGRVGAVDEGDDIRVQGGDLADRARGFLERREDP